MYRRNIKSKRAPSSLASNVPQPVVLTQKSKVLSQIQEDGKENEASDDVVQSSQNAENPLPEMIATQSTQSRFLSQRFRVSQIQQDTQTRGKNYFETTLILCKIQQTEFGYEFIIEGDDPISFIRRLRAYICSHGKQEDNAIKFIEGFREAFSLKKEHVRVAEKFLKGCVMHEGQKKHQSHTSLIQCFFAVGCMANEISKCLLENLKTHMIDRKEQADRNIVGLIVAQFKFSDQLLSSTSYDAVYEQFFDILGKTESEGCREVIISNFRDLDEFKQDDAVKRLLIMYQDEPKFLTPFIETFTEMNISEETKTQVSSLVQYQLRNGCDPKLYPGIVKYLLYYISSPEEIVESLRQDFKWSSQKVESWNDIKLKSFQLLEKSVRREKSKIAEAWIKVIANLDDAKDLKLIDFVMLLMILSLKEEKFPAIKKILLQKLPNGFYTSKYMKKCFEMFPLIIAQYSEILLELLNALQKNSIYEINEFSSTCFKELFTIDSSDKKEIIGSLVQFLCEKTAMTPFGAKNDFKMVTLNIFGAIKSDQSSAETLLLNHKILLRVLDNSKVKLTFNEHRLVMELLCSLAYGLSFEAHSALESRKLREERDVLQEHLEMLTHKLTCNPDTKIKQLGIIGAVKIVGALVAKSDEGGPSKKLDKIVFDEIPDGPIRSAAKLIKFILESVRRNPLGFAMICDELSLEFQGKRAGFAINETFLTWLSEIMQEKLESKIVQKIDVALPEVEDEKLFNKFGIVCEDFEEVEHVVRIAQLVFVENCDEVVWIAPLFKLVRLLMMHRFKGLSDSYYFNLMPLTVTEKFATPEDELSHSDDTLSKHKLDVYFHSINWLRELIGTYCHWSQDDEEALKKCVVQRVKHLVEIERHLNRLLSEAPPSYYPPPATFLDLEATKKSFDGIRKLKKATPKPPAKKTRKKNDTTVADATIAPPSEVSLEAENKIRQFCREIDSQVIMIFTIEFIFSTENVPDDKFGLNELLFLLDDLYHRVKSICVARNSEQKGFYNPVQIISDLNDTVLEFIVGIFNAICGELVALSQRAYDEENDGVFYSKDANVLKSCFSLILQLLEVLFSCPQLKLDKNQELLQATLKTLLPHQDSNDLFESQSEVCFTIIQHLSKYEGNVKNCESAVALVKFLDTISKFSSNVKSHDRVLELCENFLKTEWKNASSQEETGGAFNGNLEKLLQMYVEGAALDKLEKLVGCLSEDYKSIKEKRQSNLQTFPSFNKANLIIMVRTYLSRLSGIMNEGSDVQMKYNFWKRMVSIYEPLKGIVTAINSQNAFIAFLKNFLVFMRIFNIHGVAALKENVKDKKKFLDLVKGAQSLTRFSHGLSCDLKHRKNKSVVMIIPKLREALTKNFQSVSVLFPLANIPASDIHTGALKNFDAFGETILSQNSENSYGEEMQEEEDAMEQSDDDTIGNLNVSDEGHQNVSLRSRSTIL